MPRRRKRTKLKLTPLAKTIVAVFILAVVGLAAFIIVSNLKEQTAVTTETASFSYRATGVIIRDEMSYFSDTDFSRIDILAKEGNAVTENQEIARIYKNGYTDDVAGALYDIQIKIYECQMRLLEGVSNPEVEELEREIANIKEQLATDSQSSLGELELGLQEKIKQRNIVLRDAVQPTEELIGLYKEEETKQKQLDGWTKRIVATKDGTISTYFDGFEQSLTLEKSDRITLREVKKVLKKSDNYSTASITKEKLMYRIVQNNRFCVAFIVDDDSLLQMYKGETYRISFAGYKPYKGKCIKRELSGKEYLFVVQIDADVGDFISMRKVPVTVSGSFSGSKVRKEAIIFENSKAYIELEGGKRVEIDVLAIYGDYAIIRESETKNKLAEGIKYLTTKK